MAKRKRKKIKGCEYCENCIPIGEGDHMCFECDVPKMVISDYLPTEEYMACNGRMYME